MWSINRYRELNTLSIISIFVSLLLPIMSTATTCKNDVGDTFNNGVCHTTTHSLVNPIDSTDTAFSNDPEIKEWHFHVYWFQNRPEAYDAALRLRDELIAGVENGDFVVVLNGVTAEMLPGLDESHIPHINTKPVGPHPCGSYEVWVPKEYFADAMSLFMERRGELSILLHPLTRHEVEDHWSRNMWLGPPFRLDLTVLSEDIGHVPLQYPELKLGYSAV